LKLDCQYNPRQAFPANVKKYCTAMLYNPRAKLRIPEEKSALQNYTEG